MGAERTRNTGVAEILPGLPGGPPYVSAETIAAQVEAMVGRITALTPSDMLRPKRAWLGLPA